MDLKARFTMIDITKIQTDEELTLFRTDRGISFRISSGGKYSDFLAPKLTPDKEINVIFQYKINEFRQGLK